MTINNNEKVNYRWICKSSGLTYIVQGTQDGFIDIYGLSINLKDVLSCCTVIRLTDSEQLEYALTGALGGEECQN
jgi:hypothetical protein